MIGCFERSDRCAEYFGDVFVFHVVVVFHVEYQTLFFGEGCHGPAQTLSECVSVDMLVGLDGVGQMALLVIEREGEAGAFALEVGNAFVYGYFVEPR